MANPDITGTQGNPVMPSATSSKVAVSDPTPYMTSPAGISYDQAKATATEHAQGWDAPGTPREP